jgi:hypothetical protein
MKSLNTKKKKLRAPEPQAVPLKLEPQLVPRPLWGKSASQLFKKRAIWKRIRGDALQAANGACEVCQHIPNEIYGDPLNCHEVWKYDDRLRTATLNAFKIHCVKCDSAAHIGMAIAYGAGDAAITQLAKVNGIQVEDAKAVVSKAMSVWRVRSKKEWTLRIAKDLLTRYPELTELITTKWTEDGRAIRGSI